MTCEDRLTPRETDTLARLIRQESQTGELDKAVARLTLPAEMSELTY